FDEDRNGGSRPWRVPQAMAAAYLAGGFNPKLCEIRLYSELYSGPLVDVDLLRWPDMLVLSGLQVDFDRFLHLTAYARTLNPKVIVVAGGSLVEVLPRFTRKFFDYCCRGPVEEIREVIRDAFGADHVAETFTPRYDLAYWSKGVGLVESSRYCNFHCNFCTMSIGNNSYVNFDLQEVRRQILSTKRKHIFFLDNNFYGNNVHQFESKLEMLREMKRCGELRSWGAELTADFFMKQRNLELARESGCVSLFCGVESFDTDSLASFDKRQNMTDQVELIRRCLDAGILFLYGIIIDPTRRSLESLQAEFEFILNNDEITLPSYFTLPIPLLGTPLFFEYLNARAILPRTRVRDLDGTTLSVRPLDDLEAFAEFWSKVLRWEGCRGKIVARTVRFLRRYRRSLDWLARGVTLGNSATQLLPRYRNWKRTFVSTTECLDPIYEPLCAVSSKFRRYFDPVYVTDEAGRLNPEFEEVTAVLDRMAKFTGFAGYPENPANPVILSSTNLN
ncbi:MAG TPA: B12-binding domain-containing radical SAM protein, partial [Pyrinomonadaceae bacterium]|nr:B12-binding domain-containing radical SAM protein [Pyrinomonadaceae bacterium]